MSRINMDDEKRFCSKCNWNDCDYGCTCPSNEEVYQCPMYMHYHPDEVKEFEKAMEEWAKQKTESEVNTEAIVRVVNKLCECHESYLVSIQDIIDGLEPYQRYELLHPRKKPRGSIRRKLN